MTGIARNGAIIPPQQSTNRPGNHHLNRPNPPDQTQLRLAQKTATKNPLASSAVKNIAGLLIAGGTGAAMGYPLLVSALITVGVTSSWVGGVGLIIAGVGVGIWLVSTYLSNQVKPEGQSTAGHIVESMIMGAIGIGDVFITTVGNKINSCCCGNDVDDDDDATPLPQHVYRDTTPAISAQVIKNYPFLTDYSSMPMSSDRHVDRWAAADEPDDEEIESQVGSDGTEQQPESGISNPLVQDVDMPEPGAFGAIPKGDELGEMARWSTSSPFP